MVRYAARATDLGFDEICFTEHCPLPHPFGRSRMKQAYFEDYVKLARDIQEDFPELRIKTGIEVDYHPDITDYLAGIIELQPFDFVLGSIHIHTPLCRPLIEGKSFDEIADSAMRLSIEAAASGLFDAIAHLDFCRWDPAFDNPPGVYEPGRHRSIVRELLAVMAKEGVCLEVNSSGLAKRFAEILPCPTILEWAADFDLHYTFGSDAHRVERVGAGYGEVMSALSHSQRARLVTFRQRKRISLTEAQGDPTSG